jgi:hypothetical protein
MAKKAFTHIMAGLEDARAHINGDHTRGRVTTVRPRVGSTLDSFFADRGDLKEVQRLARKKITSRRKKRSVTR